MKISAWLGRQQFKEGSMRKLAEKNSIIWAIYLSLGFLYVSQYWSPSSYALVLR
jgi:hypothetical protein